MKKAVFSLYVFLIFLGNTKITSAQCCGADFLVSMMVQSGVNIGYGVQRYDPSGLNNYIYLYNQKYISRLTTQMGEFGTATGFKFGANLVQFQLDEFLVSIKGSYQQMREKNSAVCGLAMGGNANEEFDLTLNSLGLGISTSLRLSRRIEIKFLDAMITWNSAKLIDNYSDPFATTEQKLGSPKSKIGLSLGGGLTFYLVPPYISLEALGGYSFFALSEMQFDTGELLAQYENGPAIKNFVSSGGVFAFIQLNLAIPLK
jgi:hypothetical protein